MHRPAHGGIDPVLVGPAFILIIHFQQNHDFGLTAFIFHVGEIGDLHRSDFRESVHNMESSDIRIGADGGVLQ